MPSFEHAPIYAGNTSDVILKGLKNRRTGEVITDATVTFTLYDSGGLVVSMLENQAMPHQSAGLYLGVIPDTADIVVADPPNVYRTEIKAVIPGVGTSRWNVYRIGQERFEQ